MENNNEIPSAFERLLLKLRKNNVIHTPYSEKDIDISNDEDLKSFATELKRSSKDKANIDGTSAKFFTRIDDGIAKGEEKAIFDSRYFADLITELQSNPDCSYKTIYNDLITKDNYFPRYFSVLLKDCHNCCGKAKAELFGCRVANALGVPTAYYLGIKDDTSREDALPGEIVGDYFAVASVDFVPYNHTLETLKDLSEGQKYRRAFGSLEEWLNFLDTVITRRLDGNVDSDCMKNVKEDFIKTYLFRESLFPDYDFAVYNMGILIDNDTHKFSLTPNYDMEGVMFEHMYEPQGFHYTPRNRKIKKTINFCKENYPDVLRDFMTRLQKAYTSGEINKITEETLKTTGSRSICKDISIACQNMLDCYEDSQIKFRDYFSL